MTPELHKRIVDCYCTYCAVIKPLIANIEALSEKMPLPLFNEIRAFNDHIARCYYNTPTIQYITEQVDMAERHITRITLDCFKCLNVLLYQKIEKFDRETRNVDLTVIDNGEFFPTYSRMRVKAYQLVEKAKIEEAIDITSSLHYYEKAYNCYSDIVKAIIGISEKVKWARIRFTIKRWATIIGWIVSVIASALISAYFSCEIIANFLH